MMILTFLDPQWLGNHQALCSMPCLAVPLRHLHQCQSLPLMRQTQWHGGPPEGTECIGNSLHFIIFSCWWNVRGLHVWNSWFRGFSIRTCFSTHLARRFVCHAKPWPCPIWKNPVFFMKPQLRHSLKTSNMRKSYAIHSLYVAIRRTIHFLFRKHIQCRRQKPVTLRPRCGGKPLRRCSQIQFAAPKHHLQIRIRFWLGMEIRIGTPAMAIAEEKHQDKHIIWQFRSKPDFHRILMLFRKKNFSTLFQGYFEAVSGGLDGGWIFVKCCRKCPNILLKHVIWK